MVNVCTNLLVPASVATNWTSVLVVTGTALVFGPPFCLPTVEELEVLSTLCDALAPGGTEFADASCALGAIKPTAVEDWLAGIVEGSEAAFVPVSRSDCWFDAFSANSRAAWKKKNVAIK